MLKKSASTGVLLEQPRSREETIPLGLEETEYLINLNEKHSEKFRGANERDKRVLYRQDHPTEIGVSKCMDGRLHVPVITATPMGIIQPWRNIGGIFNLEWPLYQRSIYNWRRYADSLTPKRCCLKLVTYHFSRGHKHLGCRGFNYDREAAEAYTLGLKEQFDEDFGRTGFFSVQCGIETDLESLILHGDNGEIVDIADHPNLTLAEAKELIQHLFPDMFYQIQNDFAPLLERNSHHVQKIKASGRNPEIDAQHREWVLGFGRGFDWLHEINTALLVGPFDPNYIEALKAAAGLIYDNWKADRTNKREIVLFVSDFYRDDNGAERKLRIREVKAWERQALTAITETMPDLLPHLQILTGIVNINTRQMEVVNKARAMYKGD